MNQDVNPLPLDDRPKAQFLLLLVIAAAVVLVHMLTNARYGFHRDELQFLSDARHLDWGFVAYPPMTPFLERVGLGIFGLSLVGLRLFFGNRAGSGHGCDGADGKRIWRRTAGTGNCGPRGCTFAVAVV
jgi:hypothetical protein